MSQTLYQVSDDVLALEALLFESGGEVTPEIEAWMAENEGNLASKVDAYGALFREWEGRIALYSSEEARLGARRKTLENSSKRLKEWLCVCLERMQRDKIEGSLFTVGRQKNGNRALTIIPEVKDLPPAFQHREVMLSADRDAILAAIGKPAPKTNDLMELTDTEGRIIARLEPAGYHARLR